MKGTDEARHSTMSAYSFSAAFFFGHARWSNWSRQWYSRPPSTSSYTYPSYQAPQDILSASSHAYVIMTRHIHPMPWLTPSWAFTLLALINLCGAHVMAADGLITLRSNYGPKETMDRLDAEVRAKGLTIFARIDHAAGAAAAQSVVTPHQPPDLWQCQRRHAAYAIRPDGRH